MGYGNLWRELQQGIVDKADQLAYGTFFVGTEPIEHLIEDHTQRPDISAIIIDRSFQYFRRHINRRSDHCLRQLRIHHFLTEPKISNLDDPIMEQYIGRFEIAMQYFLLVQ